MNKQPEVTEQTRRNLALAFWSLYREKPIERITVREITERAGYNRATFYLHFHDVYDLLEQIEQVILDDVGELVEGSLVRDEKLDLSHHMGSIAQLAQRHDRYLPFLLGPHGDPGFADRMKTVLAPLLECFLFPGGDLDEGQKRILSEFYLSGLLAAIGTWGTMRDSMPIEQFIALIVSAVKIETR